MKVPESNLLLDLCDILLKPFMLLLNGFKFPLQETHKWHGVNFDKKLLKKGKGVIINKPDINAKFTHGSPLGLFHMPIFGGLTQYEVIEVNGFDNHWHVGWERNTDFQIHRLAIKENRLKLLTGKGTSKIYAVDDSGKFLPLKVVGYGHIGDGKYNGIRLF